MRIAYFGMDALIGCLRLLLGQGHTVVEIFTTEDDSYDRTTEVQALAKQRGIPVQTARVTENDLRRLAGRGVSLAVTAGYPWKIPVTDAFRQVNIHPAYLPTGRGAWPQPIAILRGADAGVTLHKISADFDAGDILLQTRIPCDAGETLITLGEKIGLAAERLLADFLASPERIWAAARPQCEGEYWPEPSDADRTINASDSAETAALKRRAFAGYGCLRLHGGAPWEETVSGGAPALVRPYFRALRLADRERMEKIRRKYAPALSDYTFALLWCWRGPMKLSVCLGEDFFAVGGDGYFFFPVGAPAAVTTFLSELRKRERVTLRFCGEREKALALSAFSDAECVYAEGDCDYVVENDKLLTLSGGEFMRRRNDFHHYCSLRPPPCAEPITRENIAEVARLSELCRQRGSADGEAEKEAIESFFELGLSGVLVRRGEPVAFAIRSEKDENTVQGHFSKCAERVRGGSLYVVKSCSDAVADRYAYTNLEDDMGDGGLRIFKRSLKPAIVPSYTIVLERT